MLRQIKERPLRLVVWVLAALVVLLLLSIAAQKLTTTASGAAKPSKTTLLHRAHRAYRHGEIAKSRRLLKKAHIMRIRLRSHASGANLCGARRVRVGSPVPRCATRRSGKHNMRMEATLKTEQLGVGWDLLRTTYAQRWKWRNGRITSMGKLNVDDHVTGWGSVVGFESEGVTDRSGAWIAPHHARHVSRATVGYQGCAPLGPGCLRISHYTHTGKFFKGLGYGTWTGISGGG